MKDTNYEASHDVLEVEDDVLEEEVHARRMFSILGNPVVEVRALFRHAGPGRPPNPFIAIFDNTEEFAETASGSSFHAMGSEVKSGVFMTINRIKDEHAELVKDACPPRSIKNHHIDGYTTLFIDIDSERDHVDGGKVCSNDREHDAAIQAAELIRDFTDSLGWPAPMIVDSGNGAYLFFRVDLPNNPESAELVKLVLETFAAEFDSDAIHIDTGVGNPARIARVAGSYNRKSPHTNERPNRMVRILAAPIDDRLDIVSTAQLKAVAGRQDDSSSNAASKGVVEPFVGTDKNDHASRVDAVKRYLEHLGIEHYSIVSKDKNEFTQFDFDVCPFSNERHKDGKKGAILVWKDGGNIVFHCFHEKHTRVCWPDIQEKYGLSFNEFIAQYAMGTPPDTQERTFNDPFLLAQQHNAATARNNESTYCFFLGDTYRYDDLDGWQKTTEKEEGPWIRETIQDAFDEHARVVSKINKTREKPKAVNGRLITDTFKALQQICKRDISSRVEPPFWLKPKGDWEAKDVLAFSNGILNLRYYVEDHPPSEQFISPTPSLFSEHRVEFDYIPDAEKPTEWHRFLESLDQDEEWYTLLQQIMGYSLWLGWDLQKYFQIVGPRRSGKGTIATVVMNLVGGKPAVCSPGLKHFVDQFGLEQGIGKRLAIVPEVTVPKKDVSDIVSNLKAITGGDLVTVNRKHQKNIPMQLRMKIWMITNYFVPLPDNSGALHARVIPLKLTKSFFGKEDHELSEKLKQEYPAILNWSLEGLKKLWKDDGKFTLPASTNDELEQLFAESAPLYDFVEQCCIVDADKGVQSPVLYKIYEDWVDNEKRGEFPLSDGEFANELRATLSNVKRARASKANQREYKGVNIVETFADDKKGRPNLWLGICPKKDLCKRARI